ncbi:ABC transporter permease [Streptomyces orinoci]|uniref:ABC transporter permease n=1 Tax=Streptomyces orinoci TaxID=67339 RepID=A0ABV3JR73_STRON|nr:ABC transporter permease [Streptomyces orinoci]
MWIRATMVYRTSFIINTLGNFLVTGLDFVALLLMFSHIHALGGFGLPEIALLYGATCSSFGLADLLLGNADRIGQRVRDGSFDILLLRPVPVLAQAAADRFAPRRLGRIVQGLLVLGWGISRVDVNWTIGKALFTVVMVISGAAIFSAVFIAGAAFQFWAAEASEVSNSFTYGGCTLLQYPPTVFARELVRGVTFVVPLAFVNWLPALRLLGREDPLGLPGWVSCCGPLVAVAALTAAGLIWRAGLRSYRSTGS